ncbi:MAG TPA: IS91 family transposase, partial [Candidatus Lokiarchaeia archaeon]
MLCHNSSSNIRNKIELADIFRKNIDKLPHIDIESWKVVNAIISCRTANLGGHVLKCDICGHEEYSYNSCRNRHCPKCQTLKKVKWLEAREDELLPVNYFHVVFTIPGFLNPIVLQNKKIAYDILFKSVKETLLESAKTGKNLGADIGFITILHTWGQNLMDHPHIHCVVPAGGISPSGNNWKSCRNNYFISIKILSKLFKGKFLDYLKKAFNSNELKFFGKIHNLKNKSCFQIIINRAYLKEWVVYAKKPFAGPKQVLDYIGRYTHRVAISNNRIHSMENDKVSFSWKDYSEDNKQKVMSLEVSEFMRRFLLHVLPKRFVRIRFFGFLANKVKNDK